MQKNFAKFKEKKRRKENILKIKSSVKLEALKVTPMNFPTNFSHYRWHRINWEGSWPSSHRAQGIRRGQQTNGYRGPNASAAKRMS